MHTGQESMTVNDEAVTEESKEADYLSVGEGCTEFWDCWYSTENSY